MTSTIREDMVKANIAIVLTDIIGSTKFVERHGNLNSAEWFKVHDRYCISLIYRFNGILCDASDGFLMYFGNVQDAVAFSFAYRKALKKHKFPFKTRIGIHFAEMLIIKTPQNLINANHKRISLEGIGKSVAARTMSICSGDQILLTHQASIQYRSRLSNNRFIPKNVLIVCAGLYRFKGVSTPEQIWILGTNELELQPPQSNEKVKKISGPKKIKTKLKNKRLLKKIEWFFWRISILYVLFLIYYFWNFISSSRLKQMWGLDFLILKPFEYIDSFFNFILRILT